MENTYLITFLINGWYPSINYYAIAESEEKALEKCYINLPESYKGYEYKISNMTPKRNVTILNLEPLIESMCVSANVL